MISNPTNGLKQVNDVKMEKETLKISPLPSRVNRMNNSLLLNYDLPLLIEGMRHSREWLGGELDSMILKESFNKQVLLTTMHKGTEINFSRTNDSVTVQVIEGKIKFDCREESVDLKKGQLLTIPESRKYSLTSIEDSVFLLTISNGLLQPVN